MKAEIVGLENNTLHLSGGISNNEPISKEYKEKLYYLRGLEDVLKAISGYNELIKEYPYEIGAYINLGGIYIKLKDFSKAEEIYRNCIEQNKNSLKKQELSMIYISLASIVKINDLNEAKSLVETSLLLHRNYDTLMAMGIACKNNGEYEKALEYYKESIEITPTVAGYLNMLNIYAIHQIDMDKALLILKKAKQLCPEHPSIIPYEEALNEFK